MQRKNDDSKAIWFRGRDFKIPADAQIPDELLSIQESWLERCDELLNINSTVSASVNFVYKGVRYEMAPPCDERLRWESSVHGIKELLKKADAEDIQYTAIALRDDNSLQQSIRNSGSDEMITGGNTKMHNRREFYMLSRMKSAGSFQEGAYNNKEQVADSITLLFSDGPTEASEATIAWTRIGDECVPGIHAYDEAWEAICSDERLGALLRNLACKNIQPAEMAEKLTEIGFVDRSELPAERSGIHKPFATISWEYPYFRQLIAQFIGVKEPDLSSRLVRSVEAAVIKKFKDQILRLADAILPELIFSELRGDGRQDYDNSDKTENRK